MKQIMTIVFVLLFVIGCSNKETFTSTDIMDSILKGDQTKSYYGEGTFTIYENEKLIEKVNFKEWVKGEKIKIHSTSDMSDSMVVNDGSTLVVYDKKTNKALSVSLEETMEHQGMTQRGKLLSMLEGMKNTHTYEVVGEEKIGDFQTHHVKVKAKSTKSLLGDFDLWVEKSSWFVVKQESMSGETKSELIYQHIDSSPAFDNDTFVLSLPDGVNVEEIQQENNKVSLPEASNILGTPFLTVHNREYRIANIELEKLEGIVKRNELTIFYEKDEIPAFMMTIFETPQEEEAQLNHDISIRQTKGEVMDEIQSISWDEKGLRYNVMVTHPDLTINDLIEEINNMTYSLDEGRS
ncbi:hypothetical protein [Bacillus sp. CGMCC 1.16541]|uniref:LolA family protein n=1 Tax=Bacillus sp. CGMCC 1.16541 TaxID=2185143 RepID=UPI000D738876|nr:hypothetical protein [Bacillus sp. CGMCC 1.16541]